MPSNRRRLHAGNRSAHRLSSLPRDTIGVGEMTSGQRFAGGCLCGGIRFVAEGPAYRVGLCHCLDCRKHGAHHSEHSRSSRPRPSRSAVTSLASMPLPPMVGAGSAGTAVPRSLAATRAPTRSTCISVRSTMWGCSRRPTNYGRSVASHGCRRCPVSCGTTSGIARDPSAANPNLRAIPARFLLTFYRSRMQAATRWTKAR